MVNFCNTEKAVEISAFTHGVSISLSLNKLCCFSLKIVMFQSTQNKQLTLPLIALQLKVTSPNVFQKAQFSYFIRTY